METDASSTRPSATEELVLRELARVQRRPLAFLGMATWGLVFFVIGYVTYSSYSAVPKVAQHQPAFIAFLVYLFATVCAMVSTHAAFTFFERLLWLRSLSPERSTPIVRVMSLIACGVVFTTAVVAGYLMYVA